MNFKHLSFGGGLAALVLAAVLTVPAAAGTDPHASAVKACTTASASQPAAFITAVDDGRGGSLVWLTDADANLWLCNADAEGHVFAYSKMTGDLLEGAGTSLVDIDVTNEGEMELPEHNPLNVAERACQAFNCASEPATARSRRGLDRRDYFSPSARMDSCMIASV